LYYLQLREKFPKPFRILECVVPVWLDGNCLSELLARPLD
jgi:hypothetical protein